MEKMCNWFSRHDPFPVCEHIFSIATGVMANKNLKIDCHLAYVRGKQSMDNMNGKLYNTTIKRSEKTTCFFSFFFYTQV